MSRRMPLNNFKWLRVNNFDVMTIPENSDSGYILEVDVAYPTYIHDEHKDLPFMPENKCVPGSKHKKLLTSLEHKKNYVCQYLNFNKPALSNGLILQRMHKIISFSQSCWLKPYIDFNTLKRKEATNDFVKDFYKLLNNSLFGKSIENIRKRKNVELVNSQKRLDKFISKPNFQNSIILYEHLCAVELSNEKLLFNKPIYIGFTVLELSKLHIYDFNYFVFRNFYINEVVNLMYLDTDSFFYQVFTDDLYEDFLSSSFGGHFDMSDYNPDHKCYNIINKNKLGCFKHECVGVPIVEFMD